jgi:hypothetical protein
MANQEKFKTMIGGQALIEGLMMRGPKKDAIVIRGKDGLTVELTDRKIRPKNSPLSWPVIRGAVTFFDSQICGVKALMRSADLSPEMAEEEPSKLDLWLEKKLGNKRLQCLHVHDVDGTNDSHTLPFYGTVNWDKVMKALADIDYKGELTFEADSFMDNKPDMLLPECARLMAETGKYLVSKFESYKK